MNALDTFISGCDLLTTMLCNSSLQGSVNVDRRTEKE